MLRCATIERKRFKTKKAGIKYMKQIIRLYVGFLQRKGEGFGNLANAYLNPIIRKIGTDIIELNNKQYLVMIVYEKIGNEWSVFLNIYQDMQYKKEV